MSGVQQRLLAPSAFLAALLFLLLTLAVWQGWTGPLDRQVSRRVMVQRLHSDLFPARSSVRPLGELTDVFGSAEVMLPLALLLAARARRCSGRYAVLLLLMFAIAECLEIGFKLTLRHPDPSILSGHLAAANSYFSGHTLRAVFCASTLVFLLPRPFVRISALALVLMIAFGLVYLGVHWLSDVIGGGLLGWTAASGVFLLGTAGRRALAASVDTASGKPSKT